MLHMKRWSIGPFFGFTVLALSASGCSESSGVDDGAGTTEPDGDSDTDGDTDGDTDEEFEVVRSDAPRDLAPAPSEEEIATDRERGAQFTAALFGEVAADDENVVFSPHSVRMAFGMVYPGTRDTVRTEFETILGFAGPGSTDAVLNAVDLELDSRNFAGSSDESGERPPIQLVLTNSLFSDRGFAEHVRPEYLDAVAVSYDAGIRLVPFETDNEIARMRINAWVSDQTGAKIQNLIKSFPPVVELVVVNALYYKASWETPFPDSATRPETFTTRAGAAVEVDTMHATVLPASYAESETQWQAVGLRYSDPRLEMVVIVPTDHAAFEASLDGEQLRSIFAALAPSTIDLALPKFQVRSPLELREPLEQLGMSAAFDDVTGFAGIPTMYPIFAVPHESFISVDEKGTEAAAATAIVFGEEGGGDELVTEHVVSVDRTFYLAIRDRGTETVLFFGRIGDPSEIES
jgi:serpin B